MTQCEEQARITLKLEADWIAQATLVADLMYEMRVACGQAAFCLSGPCRNTMGAPMKFVQHLKELSGGVPLRALPEMTPEEEEHFGKRFKECYPNAVMHKGRWYTSPEHYEKEKRRV